jgi:hypothetical protein
MNFEIAQNILRWFLLVGLQVLVFNHIDLGGYYNPLVYVLVILSLPIEVRPALVLIMGFITGLVIDLFSHTIGLHTMSFTLMAFLRPFMLGIIAPRDGYEFGTRASLDDFGWVRYVLYVSPLIFVHHLMLFSLEAFGTGSTWIALKKIVINFVLSLGMILLIQTFMTPKSTN